MLDDLATGKAEPVGLRRGEGSAGRRHDLADRACAVIPHEQASVTAGHRIVNSDKIAVRGYLVDVEAQISACPAQP